MKTNYTKKILSKSFQGKSSKDAYLKACKWIANNIVSNDKISHLCSYNIVKKDYEDGSNNRECILELFVNVSEKEILNQHCEICKESHKAFYINEEYDCNYCKIKAFDRRLDNKIKIIENFVKDMV